MTHNSRPWKIVVAASGVLLALLTSAVIIGKSWERVTERTYYGPHSDLLRAGERVTIAKDFVPAGQHLVAKGQRGIVQDEPAWDEDSCDPNRPIKIALPSGESISMPQHPGSVMGRRTIPIKKCTPTKCAPAKIITALI